MAFGCPMKIEDLQQHNKPLAFDRVAIEWLWLESLELWRPFATEQGFKE